MKFVFAVLLPFLLQLLFAAVVIFSNNGNGSFIGLGVMVFGIWAIPITAIINWSHTRKKLGLPTAKLVKRVFITTLVFPVLVMPLFLVAS